MTVCGRSEEGDTDAGRAGRKMWGREMGAAGKGRKVGRRRGREVLIAAGGRGVAGHPNLQLEDVERNEQQVNEGLIKGTRARQRKAEEEAGRAWQSH